jgi:hypothetical protein
VAALVNVTVAFAAAKLGVANACIAALAIVAEAAAELSVYVEKIPLKPKLPVTVAMFALPVAAPVIV